MDLPYMDFVKLAINNHFKGQEPWKIVAVTSSWVISTVWLYGYLFNHDQSFFERTKHNVFRLARKIPFVRARIQLELEKAEKGFKEDMAKRLANLPSMEQLPENGLSHQEILSLIDSYLKTGEYDWKKGRVSGAVYVHNIDLIELLTKVYGKTGYTNPLHADVFPGLNKMEAEIIRITADLFNGDENTCGTITTGGTESIMMAVKACRDRAITDLGINNPEILVGKSAHPAFDKAAAYFRVRIKHIPLTDDFRLDVNKMRRSISKNTCMLVGSAPNYPYGSMDDIEAISKLGRRYNIPVHVDACLGGFLLVFMERAGFKLPLFDFRLEGVTSISADTHKYGYSPKGSSVVLYRSKELLHHQYTVTTDWPGGIYGSPSVNGSRAGGAVASCWATLMYFGLTGYVEATKSIVETARYIEKELREIKEIFIFGNPVTSVIAVGSNIFHAYRLSEALQKRGWSINLLQYPPGFHLCITHVHTQPGVKESFVEDIKAEIAEIMKNPNLSLEGKMAMYGMSASIPDRSIVSELTKLFIDSTYPAGNKAIKNGVK